MKEDETLPLFEGDLKSLKVLIEDQQFPDVLILEEGCRSFVWERAFESITERGKTQFWTIYSDDYDN